MADPIREVAGRTRRKNRVLETRMRSGLVRKVLVETLLLQASETLVTPAVGLEVETTRLTVGEPLMLQVEADGATREAAGAKAPLQLSAPMASAIIHLGVASAMLA